jgi:hypothetical protein
MCLVIAGKTRIYSLSTKSVVWILLFSQKLTSTMAAVQDFTEPLKALMLVHYEEFQRGEETGDIDATVGAITKSIEQFTLSNGMQSLSLASDSDTSQSSDQDAEGVEKDLATTLKFFLDCALATETSASNIEAIDKVLELTANLTATILSADAMEAVLLRAIEFTTVLLERVRGMSCKFIGCLTKYLMRNTGQNYKLLDKASQALLPRFTDKSQSVRQAAIEAGTYFFNKDTTEPDMMQALIYAVQHDPSVVNRIAALQSLPISLETIDIILSRVRDVKAKVRVAALKVLEGKEVFDILEAEHCAALVEAGLTDR